MRRRDIIELAGILAVWAVAIILIDPRGNFPLGDDWDFAIATWNFARTGHFTFTHFTAVSLRAQVVWGALWTWVFGESFRVLRFSTLALAAVTIIVIHRLLSRAGVARTPRVIATLAFAFHPIFLWASCTYMTEVPFVCASAVAMYCFLRGIDEDRRSWVVAGCMAAIVSWFVRQTGVINLVAPFAIALWRRRFKDAAAIGATFAVFAALFFFKRDWLSGSPEEFAVHYRMWGESSFRLPQFLEVAYHWFVFNAQNSALFFLPLVAPLAFMRRTRARLVILAAVALLIFARVQALIGVGHPMPYFANPFCCDIFAGNILVNFGLGSQTLAGTFPFVLPYAARLVLTYASVVLAALLVCPSPGPAPRDHPLPAARGEGPPADHPLAAARGEGPPAEHPLPACGERDGVRGVATQLSIGTALAGTVALLGSGLYVDRYALDSAWSLVIFLALVIPWERAKIVAMTSLMIVAIFSTFFVAEYHAWNRARWRAFEDLRARRIPLEQIDGGAEVWSYYEMANKDQRWRRIRQFGLGPRRFVIAFEPLKGYRVIARYPFGIRGGLIYVNEISG
ncbi:MAG TPA: glycosyltransferase family 39 protein [Thermoanaerobaculia bacterium]|nr:glycosyltransferase family 39 protein [Thermoanaerobaculia bacterium]